MFEFPKPGEAFDGFEILEEIGEGAFARVYKALAADSDVPIALKLTAVNRTADDMVKRALREIAVLKSMSNEHTVRLSGSSIGDGYFWIAMEFLEGQQLDAYHPFGDPMGVAQAVELILQASMGLAEAHAKGVVHRDIKPANLWVDEHGTVKVLDFGFARAWGVPWAYGANATTARTVVGTPHYCQPEQLHTDQLTPASDVYSLATILYELLSGYAVLFEHQTVPEAIEALHDDPMGWLDAHAIRDTVPITNYPGCAGLPDGLLSLLERALAKDPAARPRQAGSFASALGDILVDDLGAAEPATFLVDGPLGRSERRLNPGRRRIGAGEFCDVVIAGGEVSDVHAIVDWSGSPRRAHLHPAGLGARVKVDDEPIAGPVFLPAGAIVTIGNTKLELAYPRGA